MPDEADRFGGLGDAIEEEEGDGGTSNVDEPADNPSTADAGTTAAPSTGNSNSSTEPSEDTDERQPPAEEYPEPFGFAETSQQSYYVRDETFGPISANRSRVGAVASKHGLDEDELSKRELHDAELSVLQSFEDWDIAVAVEVLERRGVDVDEDEIRAVFDVLR
ncbi:hypothetical protein Z052_00575 [Halorubrum sp. C191]|uniref:hypothetical protein n=1 Tax=Halorubrum sp. C191 TaxID=1383842 RepID=UPI000B989D25|nr:hypothetical protein [Halorubrum sp. C191]OYR86462.1 hypothetical protein DJ84_00025 [Halorubrum ezzemoulense]PHQ44096.1 hypothetical protein Z052_00575 [Halorubrum sp. C191]